MLSLMKAPFLTSPHMWSLILQIWKCLRFLIWINGLIQLLRKLPHWLIHKIQKVWQILKKKVIIFSLIVVTLILLQIDRSGFCRLLDQNKIYNLIHYSIVVCTLSKSGFSTNYYSIVVFRYHPQEWIILGNQGLNKRRRNYWDQVKMIWQFMIKIQNDNDSKFRGKWNVK